MNAEDTLYKINVVLVFVHHRFILHPFLVTRGLLYRK